MIKIPKRVERHIIHWEKIIRENENILSESSIDLSNKLDQQPSTDNLNDKNQPNELQIYENDQNWDRIEEAPQTDQVIISPAFASLSLSPSTENVWKTLDKHTDFKNLNEDIFRANFADGSSSDHQPVSSKRKSTLQSKPLEKGPKNLKQKKNTDFKSYSRKKMKLSQVDDPILTKTIHGSFYLLVTIAFLLSFVWAPFYNLGPLLMQSKYKIDQVTSSQLMGLIESIQMVFFVLLGYLADLIGGKFYMIFIGCMILSCSYWLFASNVYILAPIFVMSLAAPLHSLYWSLVSNLCSIEYIPVAFALLSCQLNLSFTLAPILYSYLIEKFKGFNIMILCSLFLTICVNILCFLLLIWDKRSNLGLNRKTVQ